MEEDKHSNIEIIEETNDEFKTQSLLKKTNESLVPNSGNGVSSSVFLIYFIDIYVFFEIINKILR